MKAYVKMEKAVTKFGEIKIQKPKFHQRKRPISIANIDIDKILVSNKVSFGKKEFKYFIGHKNAQKTNPLCMFLPKMSAYRRGFEETEYVSFLMKDDKLL